MNNLITNTYNSQSNLISSSNYASKRTSDYITDSNGNIYEVVDSNSNSTLDKNAFLNILLTQMQLQDPLNPMDSTESISQMTSFSILEQLTQITEKLDSLGQILVEMNNSLNGKTDSESSDNNTESDKSNNNSKALLSKLQTVYS